MLSEVEQPIDEAVAAREMRDLLGFPYEIQTHIISRLTPDLEFMTYLLSYGVTARLPKQLTRDVQVWQDVANYWLSEPHFSTLSTPLIVKIIRMFAQASKHILIDIVDPNYEYLYQVNGKALLAAQKVSDAESLTIFINRSKDNRYRSFPGAASKPKDYLSLVESVSSSSSGSINKLIA